jgi:hypothetical protein
MSALAKITITVGNRERTSLDLTDDEAHLLACGHPDIGRHRRRPVAA